MADKPEWNEIRIFYKNRAWQTSIMREDLEKIEAVIPLLEELNRAKELRDRLNILMGPFQGA